MKYRFIVIISAVVTCLAIPAKTKTTYIPTYRSFIQIKQNMTDSIFAESKLGRLDLTAQDGSFSITLVHEDVDKQKVKAIKRAKAAAGWMTFAALLSGFSAGFDATYYNSSLLTYVEMRRTENYAVLSDILHNNSKGEQRLTIEFFIDNLGSEELMVADMARGLTWYILPHTSMQFSLPNPGIERLRISDLQHKSVKYADIVGGSYVEKEVVAWEDDNSWIVLRFKEGSDMDEYEGRLPNTDYTYYCINKATYDSFEMTPTEFKDFKKAHKENK